MKLHRSYNKYGRMFYSRQVNHGKVFYKIAVLCLMSETLKYTCEEVHFLSKVDARSLQLY